MHGILCFLHELGWEGEVEILAIKILVANGAKHSFYLENKNNNVQ